MRIYPTFWRIYYNRDNDFPACWSSDNGHQASEVSHPSFRIEPTVKSAESRSLSPEQRAKLDPKVTPGAWILVYGRRYIGPSGVAVFY